MSENYSQDLIELKARYDALSRRKLTAAARPLAEPVDWKLLQRYRAYVLDPHTKTFLHQEVG